MQANAKDLVKSEENILWNERADVYYTSNTILGRIISAIPAVFCTIIGIRTTGDVTCTDRRLIFVLRSYSLWVLNHSTLYQIVYLDHLAGVDVGDTPLFRFLIFFLFRKKVMNIDAPGRPLIQLAFRGSMTKEDLLELLNKLTQAR